MRRLRGIIIRSGIVLSPLVFVILLCCLMLNSFLARKNTAHEPLVVENVLSPAAEAATAKSSLALARPAESDHPVEQAAFERLRVVHATVRVPQ